jgi:hypothetical protein
VGRRSSSLRGAMQGSRGWVSVCDCACLFACCMLRVGETCPVNFGISERSHRSMRGALISSIGHKGLDISGRDQWREHIGRMLPIQ